MICSLLIMTIIFINGIENTKQKVKHLDSVWKEDEIDAKTKAWLLMVESGKVDEEELRRITPKSIFIAPLLTSRTEKCQEGYRFDHLGQCVKVIKAEPKFELELLLKKLSAIYAEKNNFEELQEEKVVEEEEDEGYDDENISDKFSESSSGPLQFSIPILNEDEKDVKPMSEEINTESSPPPPPPTLNETVFVPENPLELIPVPLPIIMLNRTMEKNDNRTEDLEFSGAGPLNDTEPFITTDFTETYDVSSGDYLPEDESTTTTATAAATTTIGGLFLEDTD